MKNSLINPEALVNRHVRLNMYCAVLEQKKRQNKIDNKRLEVLEDAMDRIEQDYRGQHGCPIYIHPIYLMLK